MAISAEITGQGQPTGDIQSDGGAEAFNFSSLREQALAAMEGGTPETEQAETSQEPVEQLEQQTSEGDEPQAEATNVDTASKAQLAALKDDDVVEVEVDGEKVQMRWAEARGGIMRQSKFTKSMQQVARDREEINANREAIAKLAEEREALVSLLKNEQALEGFLQKRYPNLVRQAMAQAAENQNISPDDIATVGQIESVKREAAQAIANIMDEMRGELKKEIEASTTELEDRQASAKLGLQVNDTIGGLFKEHPYISKVVPNAEQMLRYEVLKLRPETPEQVIEAFKTVFGGWVENYKSTLVQENKQAVIRKQKLTGNNIQPSGGKPVQPTQQSFMKKSRSGQTEIDWKKLNEAAKDMLG